MSVEEYKQKRRLERILDTIDFIDEKANNAWDRLVDGEITTDGKNIIIQKAVIEGIRQNYNLLLDHHEQVQDESEPENIVPDRYWIGRRDDPIGVLEFKSRDDIQIIGLRDYLYTQTHYEEKWERTVNPRNMPSQTEVFTREFTVPEEITWSAALRLKEFLGREEGIEIKFESLEVEEHAEPW